MVALAIAPAQEGDAALWLGPLIRERVVELLAADIADAVRQWRPGAVILEDGTPYGRFLAEAAADIWKELQAT